MSTKRILGIFAHPDDEGMMSGALLEYSTCDVETGLVCATHGEVGEIADPALATPENLGEVREGEMRAAAEVLGVHNLWFLGGIIRQFRPQVMVTFDETGGYGHPDHIAIYRHTTSAFYAAADAAQYPEFGPAHMVSKLYYSAFPRSFVRQIGEWMQSQKYEGSFKNLDPEKLGIPDELISVRLDVERWLETKARSWSMHRTQMNPNNPIAQLPEEIQRRWRRYEYYQLAASRVGSDVEGENDLFARV